MWNLLSHKRLPDSSQSSSHWYRQLTKTVLFMIPCLLKHLSYMITFFLFPHRWAPVSLYPLWPVFQRVRCPHKTSKGPHTLHRKDPLCSIQGDLSQQRWHTKRSDLYTSCCYFVTSMFVLNKVAWRSFTIYSIKANSWSPFISKSTMYKIEK